MSSVYGFSPENRPDSPNIFSSPITAAVQTQQQADAKDESENQTTFDATSVILSPTPERITKSLSILTSNPKQLLKSVKLLKPFLTIIAPTPRRAAPEIPTNLPERPANPPAVAKETISKPSSKHLFKVHYPLQFADKEKIYDGSMKDYQGYSYGLLIFRNGGVYKGDCLNYVPHGQGVLKAADGTVHNGKFEHGFFASPTI